MPIFFGGEREPYELKRALKYGASSSVPAMRTLLATLPAAAFAELGMIYFYHEK
jgi:hypothetical protein